jgi:type III pantothenate kinase
MNGLILAINVGNSTAAAGLVDRARLGCERRCSCPTPHISERLAECVGSLLGDEAGLPVAVRVSNVVPSATRAIEGAIAGVSGASRPIWVQAHKRLPVELTYEHPDLLGADRIANCLYAATAHPGQNVVVIDAGTAVTVDCVSSQGRFLGGAILPGIDMQLASLESTAERLPEVEPGTDEPAFPGTSTEGCILSGVFHGVAGALDGFARRLPEAFGTGPVTILACGGTWPQLGRLVTFRFRHIPDLTLVGTALFEPSEAVE